MLLRRVCFCQPLNHRRGPSAYHYEQPQRASRHDHTLPTRLRHYRPRRILPRHDPPRASHPHHTSPRGPGARRIPAPDSSAVASVDDGRKPPLTLSRLIALRQALDIAATPKPATTSKQLSTLLIHLINEIHPRPRAHCAASSSVSVFSPPSRSEKPPNQ